MDTVVISVGGSILLQDEKDVEYIKQLAALLKRLSDELKIYIVTGGGSMARKYITYAKALGADAYDLDILGIQATRQNARVLIKALGEKIYPIPEDAETARKLGKKKSIVVMGGTVPGHTTDYVSCEVAEAVKAARLVNATRVNGIYTDDPRKVADAKHIPEMTFEKMKQIILRAEFKPGQNLVLDQKAAEKIAALQLPTYIVDGRDLAALEAAIKGTENRGTLISDKIAGGGN
jgi:uridylate kinase